MNPGFLCRLVLAAFLLAGNACAAPLTLTSGSDYAPYTGPDLPRGGMITEIVDAAFAQMRQEIRIDWLPWPRGYSDAKKGIYAATFPYVRSPEREEDFLYSESLYEIRQVVFSRPGLRLSATDLSSFRNKRICIPKGWVATPRLVPMIAQGLLTTEHPRDIGGCARMVAADRVDFFVADVLQGAQAVAAEGIMENTVAASSEVMRADSLHLIASRSLPESQELIGKFNRALRSLKASGAYDRIVARHMQ